MNGAAEAELATLNMQCDPQLRLALDAYIADFNATNESRVSIRSTTETALKKHLGKKGFWPYPAKKGA